MELIVGNRYYVHPCKGYFAYLGEAKKHLLFDNGMKLNKNKKHLIFISKRESLKYSLSKIKESKKDKFFRIWKTKILKKYKGEYDIFKNIYIGEEIYKGDKYHVISAKYSARFVDGFVRTGLHIVPDNYRPLRGEVFVNIKGVLVNL